MAKARGFVALVVLVLVALFTRQPRVLSGQQKASTGPSLDYEFFKARVQPVFLAKRPGHPRCIVCHPDVASFRLEPLSSGATGWNEEQSRKNFEAARQMVVPGNFRGSRLLVHPLRYEAGGDVVHHTGGPQFDSVNDAEWQTLAAWVRGEKNLAFQPAVSARPAAPPAPRTPATTAGKGLQVRIIQTNSAGDNVHIIDPVTDKVVGEITGIEANHGAAVPPDGSRIFVTNEADHTVDVVDAVSLKVTKKIPLTARPNNIAISRDGRKVYVAIARAPGGVDIIDPTSLTKTKTIPLKGMNIHNPFVTPDGKYLVATSQGSKPATIFGIDTQSDQPVWSMEFPEAAALRPVAFNTNADGSTKWMFVGLPNLNGFAVVDFATRKEIRRIRNPYAVEDIKGLTYGTAALNNPTHGVAVAPDQRTVWVNNRWDNAVYAYSLPDLKLIGYVPVGGDPMWMSFTPDGKKLYVGCNAAGSVSVVDTTAMRELDRIRVGHGPRRNIMAMLRQ